MYDQICKTQYTECIEAIKFQSLIFFWQGSEISDKKKLMWKAINLSIKVSLFFNSPKGPINIKAQNVHPQKRKQKSEAGDKV